MKVFLLFSMVFCHIMDDYYLQGLLINLKQKAWWEKNEPSEMYKNDYLMALIIHSFSWSFMIMLPLSLYTFLVGGVWYPSLYILNTIIHALVDDFKANKRLISLVQDQSLHILQILLTWLLYFYIY